MMIASPMAIDRMATDRDSVGKPMDEKELRKHAEQVVARRRGDDTDGSDPAASTDGMEELQVYQVELQLQNDELRDAYARLEETSREYRDLFERAPVGLVVIDQHGMIRRRNATFLRLIGVSDPGHRKPLTDYLTKESAGTWRARFRALISDPENKQIDLEPAQQRGRRRVIRLVGRAMDRMIDLPTQQEGEIRVLMFVAFDVTDEIVAREETRDLVAEKELLLRELRHRTQNHLITIQSILSFQSSYTGNAAAAEALSDAGRRIEAMITVNELLNERKQAETVELGEYLTQLIDRIHRSRSTTALPDIEHDLTTVTVTRDTGYTLGLILNELLTNAFKYAFPDGAAGTVYITLTHEMPDTGVLVVTDTGVGFVPAPEGAASAPDGSGRGGAGLHLVRGLVEQMDGSFSIVNTGNGTRCRVTFRSG